jgi:hypothetical protein
MVIVKNDKDRLCAYGWTWYKGIGTMGDIWEVGTNKIRDAAEGGTNAT